MSHYSDKEKGLALATLDANAGNLSKTARQLNIPIKTLSDWRDKVGLHPDIAAIRSGKKLELSEKLERIAHLIADAIPHKIDKAGLKDASVSLGVAIDKSRLLRELPTSITATAQSRKQLSTELIEKYGLNNKQASLIVRDVYGDPEDDPVPATESVS
jgi:hypothetical protein